MTPVLRLCEDILSNDAALALPSAPRLIFVVHGAVTIADRTLGDGETWHGEGAAMIAAGNAGATCWRFELIPRVAIEDTAAGGISPEKLPARLETFPPRHLPLPRHPLA